MGLLVVGWKLHSAIESETLTRSQVRDAVVLGIYSRRQKDSDREAETFSVHTSHARIQMWRQCASSYYSSSWIQMGNQLDMGFVYFYLYLYIYDRSLKMILSLGQTELQMKKKENGRVWLRRENIVLAE